MISIICPIMFFHENIYESINSIFSQNYKEWELLIGYPENNIKIKNTIENNKKIQNYNVKIYEFPDNNTKIDILNKLKEYSNFEWIAIKDITDCWLYEKLSQQMFIAAGNEYSIIGTDYMLDDQFTKRGKIIPSRDVSNLNFLKSNPIVNSSVIIKKELCNWTNKWKYNEEYELFINLWLNKYKFYNLSNPYIQINIESYLLDKTPDKQNYTLKMVQYYNTFFQSDGNKSFVSFGLPSTNQRSG